MTARQTLLLFLVTCVLGSGISIRARAEDPGGKTLDELLEALEDADPEKQVRAAEAIGQLDEEAASAVPNLTKKLSDEDPDVRAAAAWALGRIGPKAESSITALAAALADDGRGEAVAPVWIMASRALGQIGPAAVPVLVEALGSENSQVCRGAAAAFYLVGPDGKAAVPALVEMLVRDDPQIQKAALSGLQGIGAASEPATPVIIQMLDSQDFHVQYFAERALGAIGPGAKEAVPMLRRKLKVGGGPASVRRNAALALGGIGPAVGQEGLQSLVDALGDPLEPVRECAVIALAELGAFAQPSIPEIKRVIREKTINARAEAARTLWVVTGEADVALPTLIEELDEYRPDPFRASEILGEIGPEARAAIPTLTERLSSVDPEIRLYAARALGQIGPASQSTTAKLRQLTDDTDPDVRQAADEALKKIQAQ